MAFFKLRKAAAGEPQAPAPAPESVDALRRRARYRLAGAAMLVLAGVVGFPLLFDNQPRPIAVDIPIDIPDKAKVAPLVGSSAPSAPASAMVAAAPPAAAPAATQPVVVQPVVPPAPKTETKVEAKADSKPAAKEAKPEPKEEVIVSSSSKAATTPAKSEKTDAKADSKKDSKSDSKSPDAVGRFIVQFGAFTDSARAHEARVKVEKAGMKTYAQVIDGAEGKKFRVRVGPFEKRSDAEKAAEKIKKLDLPATVLGL